MSNRFHFFSIVITIVCFIMIIFLFQHNEVLIKNKKDVNKVLAQSYHCKATVYYISNKNSSCYEIEQWYDKPNKFKQRNYEKDNNNYYDIIYNDGDLSMLKSDQKSTIMVYSYPLMLTNPLYINTFIQNYSGDMKLLENSDELFCKVKGVKNLYDMKLIVSKKLIPIEMSASDIVKKEFIRIVYREFEFSPKFDKKTFDN